MLSQGLFPLRDGDNSLIDTYYFEDSQNSSFEDMDSMEINVESSKNNPYKRKRTFVSADGNHFKGEDAQ